MLQGGKYAGAGRPSYYFPSYFNMGGKVRTQHMRFIYVYLPIVRFPVKSLKLLMTKL